MFVSEVNFADVEALTAYFEDDPFVVVKECAGHVKVVDTEIGEHAFWTKGANGFLTFNCSNASYCC